MNRKHLTLVLAALALFGCNSTPYEYSGPRARFIAGRLRGYAPAKQAFRISRASVYPSVQGQPEYVDLWLDTQRPQLIDSARWANQLVATDAPAGDWLDFTAVYAAASSKVREYTFLRDWKNASAGRRIQLEVVDRRSSDISGLTVGNLVPRLWQRAGLQGQPSLYILLRGEAAGHTVGIAFGDRDERGLVYWSATESDFAKRHWLDRIETPGFSYDAVVLVRRSGEHYVVRLDR